jgi:2-polyprenyl-3-methyl-5-hydroxy-6-metoxy-1,4-benzoquinol methylase
MKKITPENSGQTSEEWKDGFLDLRKLKIIRYINKKRLDASGFLKHTKKTDVICDAGCGDLTLLGQLKTMGYQNLYGFDIDEDIINASSPELKKSFSEIKVGSACQIPFKGELFDSVIIWGILHHIAPQDYKTVINEVTRILKPNGKLFIVEPYPFILWKTFSIIAGVLSYLALPNFKNIHAVLSSEDELLRNFSKNQKELKNTITKKYQQICNKWHTGFWIFGGIKE